MQTTKSKKLNKIAKEYIAGGVNSPVRSFSNVAATPRIIKRSYAAYLEDIDDNRYIDYMCAWGANILGHRHPVIEEAIINACSRGICYGATCEHEILLAKKICELMPSIEILRCVNSGTEATMSAIRLARGFTSKNKIIKFSGNYHGHSDQLLVKAGSGGLTLNIPNSAGIPKETVMHTLIAPYNDINKVKSLFLEHADDIAAVILEPIAGNMNMVLPIDNFLQELREICDQYSSLLIFDEVMTGFRVALGGATEIYKVKPDLICLGKIMGGGFPIGSFGGRKDIMQHLAPTGDVYQAGTSSGNPIAMAAGLATLQYLQENKNCYTQLASYCDNLLANISAIASKLNIVIKTRYAGGMFGFNFVNDTNNQLFKLFHHAMLKHCIYFSPSAFEAGFISMAHNAEHLETTINATKSVLKQLKKSLAENSIAEMLTEP